MRTDSHYAYDDFLLYPQAFNEVLCHLPVIRRKPMHSEDEDHLMWKSYSEENFNWEADRCIGGYGILKGRMAFQLSNVISRLLERTEDTALLSMHDLPTASINFFKVSRLHLKHVLARVSTAPCTKEDARRGWVEVQRAWHSLDSLWRYTLEYRPLLLKESERRPLANMDLMGTFTHDARVALHHYNAGIPVWLIRPASLFCDENILDVVEPVLPNLVIDLPARHAELTNHNAEVLAKYRAIESASHRFALPPDPFEIEKDIPTCFPAQPIPSNFPASQTEKEKPCRRRETHRYEPYATQQNGRPAKIGKGGTYYVLFPYKNTDFFMNVSQYTFTRQI